MDQAKAPKERKGGLLLLGLSKLFKALGEAKRRSALKNAKKSIFFANYKQNLLKCIMNWAIIF